MSENTATKTPQTEIKTTKGSKFSYVTFIRTTPEKLWDALTKPEFTKQYWCGCHQESNWKVGSSWKLIAPDGRNFDSGEILEIDPPRKLVWAWQHQISSEMKATVYLETYSKLQTSSSSPSTSQLKAVMSVLLPDKISVF